MMKKTALVLEDETPLLKIITKKLEDNDFDVISARSVQQALDYLKNLDKIVDVIWLDHYLLGKESGLNFVKTIKNEDSQWKNVPIFVVSNTASYKKVEEYIKLGIEKYYTKADHSLGEIISDIKRTLKLD